MQQFLWNFLHPNNMQHHQQKTFTNDLQNFSSQMLYMFPAVTVVVIACCICCCWCCCCCSCSMFFHSYLQIIRMLWRATLWLSHPRPRPLILFFNLFCSQPSIHLSIHSTVGLSVGRPPSSSSISISSNTVIEIREKKLKTTGPILIILNFHANNAFDFNFVRETYSEKGVPIKNSTIRNCLMVRTEWMKIRYSLTHSLTLTRTLNPKITPKLRSGFQQ